MSIKFNPINSFSDEVSEIEYQVFQTLKWTFYFLTPLFSLLKNAVLFYLHFFINVFRSNDLT